MNLKYIRFFSFFFIFVLFLYLVYFQSLLSILWFCKISLIILLIALIVDSDYLYSTVLVSQSIVAIIFIVDVFSLVFFNYSIIHISQLYDSIGEWGVSIFYHLVITGVPLFILFKKKVFAKEAWLLSTILFFFFSFVIYFGYYAGYISYGNYSINCAGYCSDLGVLTTVTNFLYSLTPIPNFLINTILVGIIFYLLTLFYYWLLVKEKRKIKK